MTVTSRAAGAAIQVASPQRVWVQLSSSDDTGTDSILDDAKSQLIDEGFSPDGYVMGGGEWSGGISARWLRHGRR